MISQYNFKINGPKFRLVDLKLTISNWTGARKVKDNFVFNVRLPFKTILFKMFTISSKTLLGPLGPWSNFINRLLRDSRVQGSYFSPQVRKVSEALESLGACKIVIFRPTSLTLDSLIWKLYVDIKNGLNLENPITNKSVDPQTKLC